MKIIKLKIVENPEEVTVTAFERKGFAIMWRFLACLLFLATTSFAVVDYFPIEKGNAWTFSYQSTSQIVYPNAPLIQDSGTVTWNIVGNYSTMTTTTVVVRQVYGLVRRLATVGGQVLYDSVFSQPRITVDTLSLSQAIQGNAISFANATCAFAVHDPAGVLPTGLSIKDTTIQFAGVALAGKKITPSTCSCTGARLWSFVLAQTIGPVEAYIDVCGAGVSFHETRKLVIRDYPTAVQYRNRKMSSAIQSFTITKKSNKIICSFYLNHPSLAAFILTDLKGRLLQTYFYGRLDVGKHEYLLNSSSYSHEVMVLSVQTGNVILSQRIIMAK